MPILLGLTSSTVQPCLFNHHIVSFFSHQQALQFIPSSHSQAPQSSSSIITPYHSSPTNKASSIITPYHSSPTNKASSIITLSHSSPTNKPSSIITPYHSSPTNKASSIITPYHSSPTNKPSSIITPSHSSPTNKPSSIIKKFVAIAINFIIIEQQNRQCTFDTGSKQCFVYKNIKEKSEDCGITRQPQDICFQQHKCISPCLWWGESSIKSS